MSAGAAPVGVPDIAEDSDPSRSETGGNAKSLQSNPTFLPTHLSFLTVEDEGVHVANG